MNPSPDSKKAVQMVELDGVRTLTLRVQRDHHSSCRAVMG